MLYHQKIGYQVKIAKNTKNNYTNYESSLSPTNVWVISLFILIHWVNSSYNYQSVSQKSSPVKIIDHNI